MASTVTTADEDKGFDPAAFLAAQQQAEREYAAKLRDQYLESNRRFAAKFLTGQPLLRRARKDR